MFTVYSVLFLANSLVSSNMDAIPNEFHDKSSSFSPLPVRISVLSFSTCDGISCASTRPKVVRVQFSLITLRRSSMTIGIVLQETRRNSCRFLPNGPYIVSVKARTLL